MNTLKNIIKEKTNINILFAISSQTPFIIEVVVKILTKIRNILMDILIEIQCVDG